MIVVQLFIDFFVKFSRVGILSRIKSNCFYSYETHILWEIFHNFDVMIDIMSDEIRLGAAAEVNVNSIEALHLTVFVYHIV